MKTLTPGLEEELSIIADKHNMSLYQLLDFVYDVVYENYRKEDIRSCLQEREEDEDDLVGKSEDEVFVEKVYIRFIRTEDSAYSLWDNINNAIDWVKNRRI